MQKLFLIAFGILCVLGLIFHPVGALAADLQNGEKVFEANCAACHQGGLNVVMPNKTLKKEVLETYGMDSVDAITAQVKQGKNAMPMFQGKLTNQDAEDVAAYVLKQAAQGWKP
ncbi:c-type cytochrome [Nodosilinea sp. LEGE 07088]|uniref:cytochrome c6 PetJ n=1 Tax=Nodosilinea sp. LEGE 07088 TaxID=2777968 RepID=UPI00188247CD|nr:c-type cytochrome [Nodosilinea sp. LEGE 07088]MBE9136441.1 c-type cytochrome [Nodosilinea sp. LEGE 07088]